MTSPRLLIPMAMAALLMILSGFPAMAQPGSEAESGADQSARVLDLAAATRAEAAKTLRLAKAGHMDAKSRLSQLQTQVRQKKSALKALESEVADLRKREAALARDLEARRGDARVLKTVVRAAAADADRLLAASPLAVENPDQREALSRILDQDRHPGLDDVRALASALLAEMNSQGVLRRENAEFDAPDGRPAVGTVARVGRLAAFYDDGDHTGFLRLDPARGRYCAVGASAPWPLGGTMEDFLDGSGGHAVLDLSGGAVLNRLGAHRGLGERLASGGALVWPILLTGLAALAIVLERIWTLARAGVPGHDPGQDEDFIKNLDRLADPGDGDPRDLERQGPLERVARAGLDHARCAREVLENALHDAILKEIPRLERFLPTLAVLGAVAPLLGLLGTVTGMIHTFTAITFFGGGDPKTMSGGISEALVTTQLGLAVAIPTVLAHHFLERRVDRIISRLEERGVAVSVALLKGGGGHAR